MVSSAWLPQKSLRGSLHPRLDLGEFGAICRENLGAVRRARDPIGLERSEFLVPRVGLRLRQFDDRALVAARNGRFLVVLPFFVPKRTEATARRLAGMRIQHFFDGGREAIVFLLAHEDHANRRAEP